MGAQELRHGAIPPSLSLASADMVQALTVEQLFDSIAIRVNGPKAWSLAPDDRLGFHRRGHQAPDDPVQRRPHPRAGSGPGGADLTLTLTKPQLLGMLAGGGLEGIRTAGDVGAVQRLLGLLDTPHPGFAIVTP